MNQKVLVALVCFVVSAVLPGNEAHAGGRPDNTTRNWFGQINGGYAFTTGTTSDFVDDDWTIGGGAMYWPSSWPIGVGLDINYWSMDLSSGAVQAINDLIEQDPNNDGRVTGGDFENWQFALNGTWSLGEDQAKGPYVVGGISWNSVTARTFDNGLVYYPPFCDPWLWWCVPGGIGPGTFVNGETSADEVGWNLGLGYAFGNTGQGFLELRYQRIEFEGEAFEYVPLTIGFRW